MRFLPLLRLFHTFISFPRFFFETVNLKLHHHLLDDKVQSKALPAEQVKTTSG
jgi:hypothetical protein